MESRIINDKWEVILPQFESSSVDLGILDPPYNVSNSTLTGTGKVKGMGPHASTFEYGAWDYGFNPKPLCEQMIRLVKPDGQLYIFSSALLLPEWIRLLKGSFNWKILVWVKPDPLPSIRQRHWVSATEYILWCYRGNYTFHFQGHALMYNWQSMRAPKKPGERVHPNQKPLKLIEQYIQVSSHPGDLVLDPMAGSCTVAVAAEKWRRNWICIEENAMHCERGHQRLQQIQPQGLWQGSERDLSAPALQPGPQGPGG